MQDSVVHEQLGQTSEPTVPVGNTGQDSNPSEGEQLDAQHRQELKSTEAYTEDLPSKADDTKEVDSAFWGDLYEADYPRDEEALDDYIWCKFLIALLVSLEKIGKTVTLNRTVTKKNLIAICSGELWLLLAYHLCNL